MSERDCYGNDLFDNANSVERIICPSKNAYSKIDEVLKVYINAGNSPLDVTINNEQVLFSHLYDSSCLQKGGVIITKLL